MSRAADTTAPDRTAGFPSSKAPAARSDGHADGTTRYAGAGVMGGLVALLLGAAVILIVVAQNVERVEFEFLWWSGNVPLAVLLLATALITLALDQLIGVVWRHRRRKVRELTSARAEQS